MTRCGLLLRIKLLSSSSQGLLGTRSAMRKGCRVVSFTTPESVPAGTAQLVFEVQGHIPTGLADFAGDVSFVLGGRGASSDRRLRESTWRPCALPPEGYGGQRQGRSRLGHPTRGQCLSRGTNTKLLTALHAPDATVTPSSCSPRRVAAPASARAGIGVPISLGPVQNGRSRRWRVSGAGSDDHYRSDRT